MNRSSSIAYIDTITNLLLVFFLLFLLYQLRIVQEQVKKSPEMKAEVVIEMEWDPKSTADLDLWLMLPDGRKVGFNNKDVGVATLDRDDRGAFGDTYTDVNQQTQTIDINREVIAIRAIVPGRYVVNAHYYSYLNMNAAKDEKSATPQELTFKVTDINPVFKEVASGKKVLEVINKQATLVSFELTPSGEVVNINMQDDTPFVPVVDTTTHQ